MLFHNRYLPTFLYRYFFTIVGTVFLRKVFVEVRLVMSIVLSRITTESPVLPVYLLFMELHVAGFQK